MTVDADSADAPRDPAAEELARLRDEVARLKASIASAGPTGRRGWWRPVVAGLLVATAALLAPLSVLATWSNSQIHDTDRYLATVGPLADHPAVQEAIAVRLEEVIFSHLDLDTATEELVTALQSRGLPDVAGATLSALAGPLATGIRTFVRDRIESVVQSDAFEQAWIEANRTAHQELVAALTGEEGGAVTINRGEVSVNLATLIDAVKQQLVEAGFGIADRIPEVSASFTIIQSEDLGRIQTLLGVLEDLETWIPVLGLALLCAAVAIASDRRRMVLVSAVAVAASMLLLGASLNVIRPFYLEALPESSSLAAAGAVYDQLVSFIRTGLRAVLVLALTVAAVAWLSASRGPGASARAGLVRATAQLRRGAAGAGLRTGKLGVALAQYRGPLRAAVLGLAAVAYLAQDHPTGETALVIVFVAGGVLLVLAVLATDTEVDADAAAPAAAPGASP